MLLSQTGEYAVRVMSCLAMRGANEVVGSTALSVEASIPKHYLSKVLRKLVAAKILDATKGHGGGFRLARSPDKIRIIDIIESVDAQIPARHCIFGWRICNSNNPCILHNRWTTVNDAFQDWIRSTTVAEIKKDAIGVGWLVRTEKPESSLPAPRSGRGSKPKVRTRSAQTSKKSRRR